MLKINRWITDVPLKTKFSRLFRLEADHGVRVCERLGSSDAQGDNCWNWIRSPTGRSHDEYVALCILLSSVSIDSSKKDKWSWGLDSSKGNFETKTLSLALDLKLLSRGANRLETLRNNLIPKKVEVFIWRARKKRLPVLMELDKRGIDLHSVRCPVCDDDIETVDHSLIFCKCSFDIWTKVFDWWGINGVNNLSIGEIFEEFSSGLSNLGKKIWQAIRWTCGYLIWKNRNQRVFKSKCWTPAVAFCDIQITSFDWVAKRCKSKSID
ncbi:uncharacterized protein [Rutidosis leptorrhynchoides]|uniref:uncharacterized protein n=1 Tax=Rutidosis leptorrhynchoides TaxID=125765 RepID=UPI003A99BFCA